MLSILMMGAPRYLRASGWTSDFNQPASAAIISQVSTGGGEIETSGFLPSVTRRMGAGAPHDPRRIGGSGMTTASMDLSKAVQRDLAAAISSAGHSVSSGALTGLASAGSFGLAGLWTCGV